MHDKAIARLRFKIAAVLILKHALLWLTAWIFVWGTFVIVWRVATQSTSDALWLGLVAAPLLAVVAGGQALRSLPSKAKVRALVDNASGCGGMLMADALRPIGPWRFSMPKPAPVHVHWRGGPSLLAFCTGFAYLVSAFAFPQVLVTFAAERPFDIAHDVQQLSAQLDELKESAALDHKRAEILKDRLLQLQDNASGLSPLKTLEALDHVRDIAHKAAKEAAEKKRGKLAAAAGPKSTSVTWSHDNQDDGTRFKEATLNAAELAKLKLAGKSDNDGKAKRNDSPFGADSVATQEVLPEHRTAVERYFARPKSTDVEQK